MKKNFIIIFIVSLFSMDSRLHIIQADLMESRQVESQSVTELTGNVILKKNNLLLYAEKATNHSNINVFELAGPVIMIDGSDTMKCGNLTYFSDTLDFVLATGNVNFHKPNELIKCDSLYYWTDIDSGFAIGNVNMVLQNRNISTDYFHYKETKGPRKISFSAYGSVYIIEGDRIIRTDTLNYDDNTELMTLNNRGIIKEPFKGVLGDEMHLQYRDSTLEKIIINGSAEAWQDFDSKIKIDDPTFYRFRNEMKSKLITVKLENNEIQKMFLENMAEIIYYVTDDSLLMGINKASGDTIILTFKESDLNRIQVIGGGQGIFDPEEGNTKIDTTITYKANYLDYFIEKEQKVVFRNKQIKSLKKQVNILKEEKNNFIKEKNNLLEKNKKLLVSLETLNFEIEKNLQNKEETMKEAIKEKVKETNSLILQLRKKNEKILIEYENILKKNLELNLQFKSLNIEKKEKILQLEEIINDQEEIISLGTSLIQQLWKDVLNIDLPKKFPYLTYKDSLENYGTDKPDIRFDMQLIEFSKYIKKSNFDTFKSIINSGGRVKAIKCSNASAYSRKVIDELTDWLKKYYSAKGLAWIKCINGKFEGGISKFFNDTLHLEIINDLSVKNNELLFIIGDNEKIALTALGALRLKIAEKENLINTNKWAPLWVIDFPLFDWNEEKMSPNTESVFIQLPAGRRILALIQIGRVNEAEKEMIKLNNSIDESIALISLGITDKFNFAYTQLKIANKLESLNIKVPTKYFYPSPNWIPPSGYTVDKALVFAFIHQESSFNPNAKSRKGAMGLMQLMPSTARFISKNKKIKKGDSDILKEPLINIEMGQDYINYLLDLEIINNNIIYMAAAYNAGPGNLKKWLNEINHDNDTLLFMESIPSRETRWFMEKIITKYWIYKNQFDEEPLSLTELAKGKEPIYSIIQN